LHDDAGDPRRATDVASGASDPMAISLEPFDAISSTSATPSKWSSSPL